MTLQSYHSALGSSEKEVEVQGTLIIAVGGATPEEARDKAEFLRKDFKNLDFPLEVPLGVLGHDVGDTSGRVKRPPGLMELFSSTIARRPRCP
ncbi:hypothetical protein ACR794_13695, partial [Clavibacter sepedonicus]